MFQKKDSQFIAPGAQIIGHVELGEKVGVWYNAVIRADANTVTIGDESNVQDGVIIHGDADVHIGKRVSLGHGAIIHGATIGDNVLVGMGSIIMDDAVIGENSLVAAGALITKGKVYPPNSLIMGSPAVAKRELKKEEIDSIEFNADLYLGLAKAHATGNFDKSADELIADIRGEK